LWLHNQCLKRDHFIVVQQNALKASSNAPADKGMADTQ
jgi:hypothetical protein